MIRHIFSSDLQRAATTAQEILAAQVRANPDTSGKETSLAITRLSELRERDFGSSEGKQFRSVTTPSSSGDRHHHAESHQEMRIRVHRFLNDHLFPVVRLVDSTADERTSVVVVAHGIILNILLKVLLSKSSPPELQKLTGPGLEFSDFLIPWSNTGYLEAEVSAPGGAKSERAARDQDEPLSDPGISIRVIRVNSVDHLQGLKKTGGGIGSSKFDPKQKSMESFFAPVAKKSKTTQERPE